MKRALPVLALLAAACGSQEFTEDHDGRTVTVDQGDTFAIVLAAAGAEVRRYAHVAGQAIEQVEPDRTGQASRFEFRAVRKGQASITVSRVYPQERTITGVPRRDIAYSLNVTVE